MKSGKFYIHIECEKIKLQMKEYVNNSLQISIDKKFNSLPTTIENPIRIPTIFFIIL